MTKCITAAVDRLKSSIHHAIDPHIIQEICLKHGHRWRDRTFDPVTTIWLFALQILNDNTSCNHAVRLMPNLNATGEAYGQARARIPLTVFKALFQHITRTLFNATDEVLQRWHGRRVFYIDGSTCSMPDEPNLQETFGQPSGQKPGCGFPVAKLVGLFHAGGVMINLLIDPLYTHEARVAHLLFKHLRRGDVLVGDRAFSSYVFLAMLTQRGVHAVMRQHQRRPVNFRHGRLLAKDEQIIELTKPLQCPKWMDRKQFKQLPDRLKLRQIKYRIESNGYRSREVVLLTTLLDADEYPLSDVAELYGKRWQVETYFRYLKQTMHMDTLRCKTPEGVQKELWMFGIVYNLVRSVMVEAGLRQDVDPERISFIDVLRWLTARKSSHDPTPKFVVNPYRPGRHQPRVRKRRPKQYPLMTQPRSTMSKSMLNWKL